MLLRAEGGHAQRAEAAGVETGDRLVSIDGQPISSANAVQVTNSLVL
jgi:membrane-associated protease RseP (regulator of RpoE activity)